MAADAAVSAQDQFVDLTRLQEPLAGSLQAALYANAMILDQEQPGVEAPRAAQGRLRPVPVSRQLQGKRAARPQAEAGQGATWLANL